MTSDSTLYSLRNKLKQDVLLSLQSGIVNIDSQGVKLIGSKIYNDNKDYLENHPALEVAVYSQGN